MSIRWKLFSVLFLLMAGATAAVLLLAERTFRKVLTSGVEETFSTQVDGLLEARRERLTGLREACEKHAAHPALRAELQGETDLNGRRDFLRGIAESWPSSRLPPMGLITRDGELRPFGDRYQVATPRSSRQRKATFELLEKMPGAGSQEIGYVAAEEVGKAHRRVLEVVLTPVRDERSQLLGWYFLGVDAETPVERAFQLAEQATGREARTGLVVGDDWFVPGFDAELAGVFANSLGDSFWEEGKPRMVETGGHRYLAIARNLGSGGPLGEAYQVGIFPLDPLVEAVTTLRTYAGILAVVVVVVAAGVAFLLARRFSRPIRALVAGTERVREGDFGTKVEVRSRDEFGVLAKAFNAMTDDLALKERYHEVLAKVSDASVARQLMEGKLELGGETREAAVLFCDIRGFTAMTEGMAPAEVIGFLNEHMTVLTTVVHAHGGVVDKFVGDLIMAVFGVPVGHGAEAARAARCALDMIGQRARLDASSGREVKVGIGIACGEVLAGCMGSEKRLNYTVLGERVNLASRLCSAAQAGEILVDAAVAAAVTSDLVVEERPPINLRGFSQLVPVFALTASGA